MEETLYNSSQWKKKPFVENSGCGKWAGGPASRVWVNQW
jgi:hypothetical protein